MLGLLLILFVIGLTYYLLRRPFKYWPNMGVKQGQPFIIFGDSWKLVTQQISMAGMMEYLYYMHPNERYSGFYQFSMPTLLIRDPDLIKQILVKDFDNFTDHRLLFPGDDNALWSRNLFTLRGKQWRDMRSTLSPSFTSSKMKFMFGLIEDTAQNFVEYFRKLNDDEVEVDLKDVFARFTNDVIASSAFGLKVDSLKEKENQFYLMGKDVTALTGWKFLKFFGYTLFPKLFKIFNISFFDRSINEFFVKVVQDTIKAREDQNIVRPDMIHLLMQARIGHERVNEDDNVIIDNSFAAVNINNTEAKIMEPTVVETKNLTDLDIAAQAMIFFLAGFDSVSGLLSFMGYELAVNPEVQNRLRKEILSTFKSCNQKLTYEALLKMKYLDMVVSEVLRKWPTGAATERVCTKPYSIKAVRKDEVDIQLPVKTNIWVPIYALHYDTQYYQNPHKFDPERFNDENKSKINPYTYLPFGLGPRGCIGSRFALMEAKLVMFYLLKDFEIVPCAKSIIPLKIHKRSLTLTAKDGFYFKLKPVSI